MASNFLVGLVFAFGLVSLSCATAIKPRMINGTDIDTLKRFPHHVTIESIFDSYQLAPCGGSILNRNWILTSASCVRKSNRLVLHFQKLHKNNTAGSYSIIVNHVPSNVHVYPTESDDIALIKIPVDLIYSDILQPIEISDTPSNQLQNKLLVLPGFDSSSYPRTDSLTYAMLAIVSSNSCKNSYKPGVVDEYLNICTKAWGSYPNMPCMNEFGSGLVEEWPRSPKLVGVYSTASYDCDSSAPSVYVNLSKYKFWIDSLIWSDVNP